MAAHRKTELTASTAAWKIPVPTLWRTSFTSLWDREAQRQRLFGSQMLGSVGSLTQAAGYMNRLFVRHIVHVQGHLQATSQESEKVTNTNLAKTQDPASSNSSSSSSSSELSLVPDFVSAFATKASKACRKCR